MSLSNIREIWARPIVFFNYCRRIYFRVWIPFKLKIVARMNGGEISFGKKMNIECPIVFQGRGCVEFGNDIQLGFHAGGSINSVILI